MDRNLHQHTPPVAHLTSWGVKVRIPPPSPLLRLVWGQYLKPRPPAGGGLGALLYLKLHPPAGWFWGGSSWGVRTSGPPHRIPPADLPGGSHYPYVTVHNIVFSRRVFRV
jgi:hypothetical protein